VLLPVALLLLLVGPLGTLSAQTAGTYVCTARDASRQAGFVSQLFNVSQADAANVDAAWVAAVKQYGVTPSTPPACQGFAKFTSADSARKQFIAFVTNSLEYRIDQMRWTYRNAPPATGDAPAAMASAAPTAGASAGPAGGQSAAQAEMAQAKGYCVQNHSGLYDCDGYAKAVYDHRVAHPEELVTEKGGERRVPTINALETGAKYHLDCTSCLNDKLLFSWAREAVRYNFSAAVLSKAVTQAKVDAHADCVAKNFVPEMHAKPNVDDYMRNFNDAMVGCGKPY
jgi:hypothetical protein